MSNPSDDEIHQTLIDWATAEVRWMEYVLADRDGSEAFWRLHAESTERFNVKNKTKAALLALGMRLLQSNRTVRGGGSQ